MALRARLTHFGHAVLSFSVSSATCFTILMYTAIFVSSIVLYEVLPHAPATSQQLGLDLTTAVRDLQIIAGEPHPYNSHANDAVRSHILSRVIEVSEPRNNVAVFNDLQSNATWYNGVGIYFEGNNILVKIDGKQPELEAVLFSAHFDSVSTAPGATDDGIGVVTLLQLVDYFANHTPKRTVIFNINNGEEDGLSGAHAFLEHPWSSLPKLFLNLEGAGAGGRPLLFRTSSTPVTRAFQHVPHPHGSVLSSDAFARGLVRSGTDFSVYQTGGMKGLDLAFYRPRCLYHTRRDSVPSLGGPDALWNMMESALMSGIALTESIPVQDVNDPVVYFDIFGESLAVFSLRAIFILNLVFIIVGPILVAASVAVISSQGKFHWSPRGWFRLPFAMVLGIAVTFGMAVLLAYVNPYIVFSSGYAVTISFIAIAFLAIHTTLASLSSLRPVPQQKSILLLETYLTWWALLVFNTIVINNQKIGGFYVITFFHVTSLVALLVTFIDHLWLPSFPVDHIPSPLNARDVGDDGEHEDQRENDHSETTPLIQRQTIVPDVQESEHYGFWLLEYLLLVPFPVILVTQTGTMLLGTLPQTLADGSPCLPVYFALALMSFLLVFPVAPFAHKLHHYVFAGLLLLFLGTGIYNFVVFPFSLASPLKVFFYQSVNLGTGSNVVNLTGLAGYVDKHIIPSLPSAWNHSIECSDSARRPGLLTCQWEGLAPAVVSNSTHQWLSYDVSLAAPGTALITVQGTNTRSCRVYFDHPVTSVRVENSTGEVQSDYLFPVDGITELRLWSRTWSKEFALTVTWKGKERLTGRVSCGWAENLEGRIPALAEVIGSLPDWALVTKLDDALVEAWQKFSV